MKDEVGNEVKVGDVWVATAWHSGRGVASWMVRERGKVVALKRSRVVVTYLSYGGEHSVGPEIGIVVGAGDGRDLRRWSDVRREERVRFEAEEALR